MKKPKLLALGLFAFSFIGGDLNGPPNVAAVRRSTASRAIRVSVLRASIDRGGVLYRAGRYQAACEVFQAAFAEATASSLPEQAGRALGNFGGCQFALHQYQAALRSFLEARRLSESAGDRGNVAVCDANIASLYLQTGEVDAAAEWASRSLERVNGKDRAEQLPKLQLALASLRALQGRMTEATVLFKQAIEGADRMGNLDLYAIGWNNLGAFLWRRGDLAGAETALLEAYRTRKLHHLALESSYSTLGRLRLSQGDVASASALLDQAVEAASPARGMAPSWYIYYSRSLVRMAQGRLPEALSDLRIALRLGRAWRWSAPANESVQVGAEGWLDQVHSEFVEAGNRLYLETHDPALKRETFTANEENRAVSLRTLWNDGQRGSGGSAGPELPASYWEALARLQRAEVAALRSADTAELARTRAELVRMAASAGGAFQPLPEDLPEAARRKLDPGTALFSFHLGASISWVWALDRAGLEVYALPPRAAIEAEIRDVTAAIRDDRPDAAALSAGLYRTIFAPVASRFRNAPRWLLALDGALFEVPIAALVEAPQEGTATAPAYLAVRHTVELIPGLAYWLESGERSDPQLAPLFVGIGDPVYNRADVRGTGAYGSAPSLVLSRLVGSGAEIEASARAWQGRSVLLRGTDASREKLAQQLSRHPAAVHLATHYVESAGQTRYSLIALSLTPTGDTEVLSPLEISGWRIRAGMVVLSGCHSASGAALPGEGVMGLTRAWLAAGAHSVVGSLWDTPDDDGAFFGELYRSLRALGHLDAGQALRQAQLRMIESGGRRGRPYYWGAFFTVANQGAPPIPREALGEEP